VLITANLVLRKACGKADCSGVMGNAENWGDLQGEPILYLRGTAGTLACHQKGPVE